MSFQTGYSKLERFLHKNQHTQRKLSNFGKFEEKMTVMQRETKLERFLHKNQHDMRVGNY